MGAVFLPSIEALFLLHSGVGNENTQPKKSK